MKYKREYYLDLAKVVTVHEVCELWEVDQKTVVNWIDKGYIAAIQERPYAPWLISIRSVVDYRGLPAVYNPRLEYLLPMS